jgi:hypothetical protein
MRKAVRPLSYGAITVGVLLAPSLLVMLAVPCTRFAIVVLLPFFAIAGYVASRASALRTDLSIWLFVGLLYNLWWVTQSVMTATPLRVPVDLGRAGETKVYQPWRFRHWQLYVLRLRLHDPVGREQRSIQGDPRFKIWFDQPPVVDITISGQRKQLLRLNGELSRASLCSGFRECNTSRDELLFDCAVANFFRPDPYRVNTVVIKTIRGTPSAAVFAPRLEITAVSAWDPVFCAVQGVTLAFLFAVITIFRLVSIGRARKLEGARHQE